jgi:glycerol uptake facilitator-like aquaporin
MSANLARRAAAEAVGTAFLLAAIVGSGIMAEHLAAGNIALALLANALATGGALVALILAFGPISGAHFNPAVTLADAWQRGIGWGDVPAYVFAQITGAFVGVALANWMFGFPLFFESHHARTGSAQWVSECVATFGLLATIWGCARSRPTAAPYAVAAYIVAAYWFTPSTSFANPAVTLARVFSDTFAGIRPTDAAPFIFAQLTGSLAATAFFAWLVPSLPRRAESVVVPHTSEES